MVEVWPENETTLRVFIAMGTQWRAGFSGPTGLDYGALPAVMRLTGVPRAEWPDVFAGLREMEAEALLQMRKK